MPRHGGVAAQLALLRRRHKAVLVPQLFDVGANEVGAVRRILHFGLELADVAAVLLERGQNLLAELVDASKVGKERQNVLDLQQIALKKPPKNQKIEKVRDIFEINGAANIEKKRKLTCCKKDIACLMSRFS